MTSDPSAHPPLYARLVRLGPTRAANRPPTLLRALLDAGACRWPDIAPTWQQQQDAESRARTAAGALPHAPAEDRANVFRALLDLTRSRQWDPFSLPLAAPNLRDDERQMLLDRLLAEQRPHDLARLAVHLDDARWQQAWRLPCTPAEHAALWAVAPRHERAPRAAELRQRLLAAHLDIASHTHDRAVAAFLNVLDPPQRTELLLRVFTHSSQPDSSAGSALAAFGHLVTDRTLSAALPLLDVGTNCACERARRRLSLARGRHRQADALRREAAATGQSQLAGAPSRMTGRELDLLLELAQQSQDPTRWQQGAATVVAAIAPDEDEDSFEPIHWDHLLPRVARDQHEAWLQAIDTIDAEDVCDEALAAACRHWL